MIRFRKSTVATAAGLAALMLLPAAGFAGGQHGQVRGEAPVASAPEETRLAHMGRGPAGGPGMMAPGQGYGPGPYQGYGAGYGMGPAIDQGEDLSADDVRDRIERNLAWHGNERLMVGEVKEAGDDSILADIVTKDGSLVRRFEVDRHTGQMRAVE